MRASRADVGLVLELPLALGAIKMPRAQVALDVAVLLAEAQTVPRDLRGRLRERAGPKRVRADVRSDVQLAAFRPRRRYIPRRSLTARLAGVTIMPPGELGA